MRVFCIVFVLLAAASAAPAAPQFGDVERSFPRQVPHRAECIKLTKQILRYADVVEMARDRNNDLWEEATVKHIGRLTDRRRNLCPKIASQWDPVWRRLGQALGIAASAAVTYFTSGLF